MTAGSAFGAGAAMGGWVTDVGTVVCPCGSGRVYPGCCGLIHDGVRPARTAEALMRSRYSAFALHHGDYILRTWHPATVPSEIRIDPAHRWVALEILRTTEGGPKDVKGTVTYRAHSIAPDGTPQTLTEHSRFERHQGVWVYVDGDILD